MGVVERLAFGMWARLRRRRPLVSQARPCAPGPRLQLPSLGEELGWTGRAAGRHRWLLDGARRGTPDSARLAAWLDADTPGEGPDWEHASDAAARLVSWALAAAAAPFDEALWARLAGSATAHAVFTSDRLALREGDHRAVLQAAGLALAGMTFALPEARDWTSEGLAQLAAFLPRQIHADGSGDPRTLGRSVAAAWAVLQLAEATGTAVDPEVELAVRRAAPFLALLGSGGAVETTYEPLLGWEDAIWAELAPDELVVEKDWSLRAFREGGIGVAHARLAKATSRFVLQDGVPRWDVCGQSVLTGGDVETSGLAVARVDGRRVTLTSRAGDRVREVRLEGGRVQFVDRGADGVSFSVGLPIERTDKGWALQGEGFRVVVTLDDQLDWTAQGSTFVGRGRADRVRTSFELR